MPGPGEDILSWSVTAANNSTADSKINWAEFQTRDSVNNSSRSEMAAHAKDRNLKNASIPTTGSDPNNQAFSSGVGYTDIAQIVGMRVTLKVAAGLTNTGPVTLNCDGLGAKPVKKPGNVDLQPFDFSAGSYPDLIYDGTNFVLQNPHETNIGGTPTTISRTVLAGSGNYNPPTGCLAIEVEMVGGGAGGGGALDGAGGPGGQTTFGTLVCQGGASGAPNGSAGGAGGTASGGDVVISGGRGDAGQTQLGNVTTCGGSGGSSAFGGEGGGAGAGGQVGGNAAPGSGSGGGGGARFLLYGGSGGGAGGYLRKLINNPVGPYAYSVGIGGFGGTDSSGFVGGVGGSGTIIVTEYVAVLITSISSVPEAPNDGTHYARFNLGWADAWASPLLTGAARAPTPSLATNDSSIATTAWVTSKLAAQTVFAGGPANGLVPGAGAGGTLNFLRADGTWQQPPSGGGSGITSINTMTGPGISIVAGTGISIGNAANTVTITNTSTAPFTTGDIKWTHKQNPDTGWIFWQDGTIGDASSGGTIRANADTLALFTLYFQSYIESDCPLQNSAGTVITRASQGNNATTAFNAHCRQALPLASGRVAGLAGSGAGLSPRQGGNTAGAESVVLAISQMPSHQHSGVLTPCGNIFTGVDHAGGSDGNSEFGNPGLSTATGGSTPVSLMQPTTFLNAMIKL